MLVLSIPNLYNGGFVSGLKIQPGISRYSESARVALIHPSMTLVFNLQFSMPLIAFIFIILLKAVDALEGLTGLSLRLLLIKPVLGFLPDLILRDIISGLFCNESKKFEGFEKIGIF